MTDAPEHIWAFEDYPGSGAVPRGGMWCDEQSECPEGTPAYVRADLVEALEAENQRLREALHKIEAAPAWGYPDRWETTPTEVRQLARAALRSTEASHDAILALRNDGGRDE